MVFLYYRRQKYVVTNYLSRNLKNIALLIWYEMTVILVYI
jgi:hypothetical protein